MEKTLEAVGVPVGLNVEEDDAEDAVEEARQISGATETLGDVNGSPLLLPSGKTLYRRLLAHHSVVSPLCS